MKLLRIQAIIDASPPSLRMRLTDGQVVDRDLSTLLTGPIFEAVRGDESFFRQVQVEAGGLAWPNGADLCPDMVIWGGLPPES